MPSWYVTSEQPEIVRWWDGRRWTDFTATRPVAPPKRSKWAPALVLPLVLLAGGAVMFGSMLVYATFSGRAHDAFSLDDPEVRAAAAQSCRAAADALDDRSGDRVANIRRGNAAIDTLVSDMWLVDQATLAGDKPALEWITDWERLAASRATLADALEAGSSNAAFDLPTIDGYPITERMADVAPEECGRPIALAADP